MRGSLNRRIGETPPHPALRADLSPQAGRGALRSLVQRHWRAHHGFAIGLNQGLRWRRRGWRRIGRIIGRRHRRSGRGRRGRRCWPRLARCCGRPWRKGCYLLGTDGLEAFGDVAGQLGLAVPKLGDAGLELLDLLSHRGKIARHRRQQLQIRGRSRGRRCSGFRLDRNRLLRGRLIFFGGLSGSRGRRWGRRE